EDDRAGRTSHSCIGRRSSHQLLGSQDSWGNCGTGFPKVVKSCSLRQETSCVFSTERAYCSSTSAEIGLHLRG
ncbi:hypothetical protein CSUI_005421, partial [Cystoisospora suis]